MDNSFFLYNPSLDEPEVLDLEPDFTLGDPVETITIEEDSVDEDIQSLTPIPQDRIYLSRGNGKGNALEAETIIWLSAVPQYPTSLEKGYAYCVRLPQLAFGEPMSKKAALKRALDFQYSKSAISSDRPTFSPYLNAHGRRWKYKCTGIKHCEYLQDKLRFYTHNRITPKEYTDLQEIQSALPQETLSTGKKKATGLYIALRRRSDEGGLCRSITPTCELYMGQQQNQPLAGQRKWFIGCKAYYLSPRTERHFIRWVTDDIDLEYLQQLFLHGLPQSSSTMCNVIGPQTSNIKTCDHPCGQGKMQRHDKCTVEYHIIIPDDLQRLPHFLLVAIGTHSHAPPPPFIPTQVSLEVCINILHPQLTPQTSRSDFLKSPQLLSYLKSKGHTSIVGFDNAFTNKDRIARLIARQKLACFPLGGDIEGVIFEWKANHQEPTTAYIRHITSSPFGTIIICFFDEQAKILLKQKTFQIDMSFKRLAGRWSEVLFAVFLQDHGKIITLGRIITDSEKSKMYEIAFTRFFSLVAERGGQPVRWFHLHTEGFYGITVDMDSKQMAGFGRYLSLVDPQHRGWQWQLISCQRFCQVHFMRSIHRACPLSPRVTDSPWGRLRSLLNVETQVEYYKLCDLIESNEALVAIKNWVKHKRHRIIAAGLVQSCSNIPKAVWNLLETTSNAAEQAGSKGYRTGTKLPLIEGVKMAIEMDKQDLDEYAMRDKYGSRHADRNTLSMSQRYSNNIGRELSKTT